MYHTRPSGGTNVVRSTGYTGTRPIIVTCPLPALISVVGLVRAWVPAGGDPYPSVSPTRHKARVRPRQGKSTLWEVSFDIPTSLRRHGYPRYRRGGDPPASESRAPNLGEVSSGLALPAGAVPPVRRSPTTRLALLNLRASRLAVARNRIFLLLDLEELHLEA